MESRELERIAVRFGCDVPSGIAEAAASAERLALLTRARPKVDLAGRSRGIRRLEGHS